MARGEGGKGGGKGVKGVMNLARKTRHHKKTNKVLKLQVVFYKQIRTDSRFGTLP